MLLFFRPWPGLRDGLSLPLAANLDLVSARHVVGFARSEVLCEFVTICEAPVVY